MADFGELLRSVGDFGIFQHLLLVALCSPAFVQSFSTASIIFIEEDPKRHCNTDWILGADPNLTSEEQLNLTVPREQDGSLSRCRMFVPVDWNISEIRERGLNETTECVSGWLYHSSLYTSTIVTDFDLVCSNTGLRAAVQTALMVGILLGAVTFGPMSNSIGRRRAIQIAVVFIATFSVLTALSPNIYVYLVSLLMVGFGGGGYQINSIILSAEWIGAPKRSRAACGSSLIDAVGQCALAGVVYLVRDWRLTQLITASAYAVVLIYIWFIPESARWLLNRGRTEEAKKLLVKAATINKRTIPPSLLDTIQVKETATRESLMALFRSPLLTRFFAIILLASFSMQQSFFMLYLLMPTLGLNVFLTQFIFGASEIPVHVLCMWLVEFFGRKALFIGAYLVGGCASLLMLAVPAGYPIAVTVLAVIGRLTIVCSISLWNIYIQELFPTSVRQSVAGLGAIAGRLGSITSPLLNLLRTYQWFVPTTVFGSLCVITGALGFLLPETRNKELPETILEAESARLDCRMSSNRNVISIKRKTQMDSTRL
ncbi:solute carrier family 22 member 13-like isoform X2 [Synchiropus splendidus]|uniref:solute carrier family 22 member 13-like isoform X2 n=1 Tax=Synchiropus splendidus TaxID=270530 RepID=UPI00237E740D|nr:solute carrier family 22 member 13-like isoform X2 [Synchiropus splendidus]